MGSSVSPRRHSLAPSDLADNTERDLPNGRVPITQIDPRRRTAERSIRIRTGLLVTKENWKYLSAEDQKDWNRAIADYFERFEKTRKVKGGKQ